MVMAGLLGAFLGYRLWRRLLPSTLPPARETAQAQTLIAIAGALMVVVIGQNTARAFGLVGLGGFIRFRSGIKDTRDAAVMFVMIGIGMACGAGRGADGGGGDPVRERRADDLRRRPPRAPAHDEGRRSRRPSRGAAWERIRLAFPGARVLELPGAGVRRNAGKLVMETALGGRHGRRRRHAAAARTSR